MVSFTASGIRLGCSPQARSESSMRCISWDRPKIPNRPSIDRVVRLHRNQRPGKSRLLRRYRAKFPKDLGTWSKDFQRMPTRVEGAEPSRDIGLSYALKVMLFCLALTMCIIGVSQQLGLSFH